MENNKGGKFFVTAQGLEKLKNELENLTTAKRKEVAERIQSARELGDITENSEYESALEEQAFIEGRITELEEVVKRAEVITKKDVREPRESQVSVGSRVLVHLEGSEQEFEIVGELEADPNKNKISHESPLGQALLGKKTGDKAEVEAPVGKLIYTILKIF
ncbi:MAG: transcription elongation factor GreA [Patescibacteria group bacterium]|nr:transcription elongation factor GreA [Patescibacteria group bacterium]